MQLELLDSQVRIYHELVNELQSKIAAILCPQIPNSADAPTLKPPMPSTDLGSMIATQTEAIKCNNDSLKELVLRIEL